MGIFRIATLVKGVSHNAGLDNWASKRQSTIIQFYLDKKKICTKCMELEIMLSKIRQTRKKTRMHMYIGAHTHRQDPDTFKKHICKIRIILVVNVTQLERGNLN